MTTAPTYPRHYPSSDQITTMHPIEQSAFYETILKKDSLKRINVAQFINLSNDQQAAELLKLKDICLAEYIEKLRANEERLRKCPPMYSTEPSYQSLLDMNEEELDQVYEEHLANNTMQPGEHQLYQGLPQEEGKRVCKKFRLEWYFKSRAYRNATEENSRMEQAEREQKLAEALQAWRNYYLP